MARAWANKIDATQHAIVHELRARGATVYSIGKPIDLVIGWRGQTILAEVKAPKPNGEPKPFKASQVSFFESWRGGLAVVLTCTEDAARLLDAATAESLRPTPEQLQHVRD